MEGMWSSLLDNTPKKKARIYFGARTKSVRIRDWKSLPNTLTNGDAHTQPGTVGNRA